MKAETTGQLSAAVRHFAVRGWVLAALFILLLLARAAGEAPLRPAWLLLVAAGIALRAWAGAHLGPHGNGAQAEVPALATTGPYRFSRNPLYLANMVVSAGLILFANVLAPFVAFSVLCALILHHAMLVRYEEHVLSTRVGAPYDAYRHAVPRWFGIHAKRGDAPASTDGAVGVTMKTLCVRQGRNIGYTLLAVLLVWIAAR